LHFSTREGSISQVIQSPLRIRDQIKPGRGGSVFCSAPDSSSFRQPHRLPLWSTSFCNLHNRPEDGALDPEVKGQRLHFHIWTGGKVRCTRTPNNLLSLPWLLLSYQGDYLSGEGTLSFCQPPLVPLELLCC
jgi:hypothetical protein